LAGVSLWKRCLGLSEVTEQQDEAPVDFGQMAALIAQNIDCNVYIVGRRGRILGWSVEEDNGDFPEIEKLLDYVERFPESFNRDFLNLSQPLINRRLGRKCVFRMRRTACDCKGKVFTIIPVQGGRSRLATLVLYRREPEFSEEELVLGKVAALVIANEIMYLKSERQETVSQRKASLGAALAAISQSEREALYHLLSELKGKEGVLVASHVADRVGLTRSVVASALRKFESAGIIESRSLGMKGTYIRLLVDNILDELRG